ncbi:uncharacterized protein [Arachis hypogaea]|uniref:uncharacterized protein n=1 Tax=Arachis hypogaea TaxID=3818 RepID=UPI003B20E0E9
MGEPTVKKVLLDPGSSADLLFYSTFKKIQLRDKALQPSTKELVGFSGKRVPISGYVWLRTILGEFLNSKTLDIQFLVVDSANSYNIILGLPSLNSFRDIVSIVHLRVKFPVQDNILETVHAEHKEARQCYNAGLNTILKEIIPRVNSVYNTENIPTLSKLDPRNNTSRPAPTGDLQKVQLVEADQFTNIGSVFSAGTKQHLVELLRFNSDLFAWTLVEMPGINPNFICYKLTVNLNVRPVRQKTELGYKKEKHSSSRDSKIARCRIHSRT